MTNGCSLKCQAKSKKKESKKLKEESDEETMEQKQVSDQKDKKEKSFGCCTKCKGKSNKMKKSKKLKEESDEEDVKQTQKTENGNPKTDSNKEKGSHGTSDEKCILTWRHKSTKKDKGHCNNLLSQNGLNPPSYTARSMMYHRGPNPSNRRPMSAAPIGLYPAFSKAPMYGPCGGGGPVQPDQSMNPAFSKAPTYGPGSSPFQLCQSMNPATMYNGAHISPYPPMAAAVFPPYLQARPFTDANPMTCYTSYRDNYSYFFI